MRKAPIFKSRFQTAVVGITCGVGLALAASPAQAATFSVTSTLDAGPIAVPGSLRQAITDANATPGLDRITFNIAGASGTVRTINLLTELPPLTDPAIIDGFSQPGAAANTQATGNNALPLIELNGGNSADDGIQIDTNDSTVRGLIINRFMGDGITIGESSGGQRNSIIGCFIGTNASGTADAGNGDDGIDLSDSDSDNNRIGGVAGGTSGPADRNIISGNTANGIAVRGDGNVVQNSYLGTDRSGTTDIGNDGSGVLISGGSNVIGGTTSGERNIISGNTGPTMQTAGVSITGAGAINNRVAGNFIGLNASGTVRAQNGLVVSSLELANDIGVSIGGGATRNIIGATLADDAGGNLISGNTMDGIVITGVGTSDNMVRSNFIGPDTNANPVFFTATNPLTGTSVPTLSQAVGVLIQLGATRNKIGVEATGSASGSNLISGNAMTGVTIQNAATNENIVRGNRIGTNAAGNGPLSVSTNPEAVQDTGIHLRLAARFNTIGFGPDADASSASRGNIIAFNDNDGVLLGGTGQGAGDLTDANPIRLNSIFSNGGADNIGLGINVDSAVQGVSGPFEGVEGRRPFNVDVTMNDPAKGDDDTGPNNEQNHPDLEFARNEGSGTRVRGTLNAERLVTLIIDFYANQTPQGGSDGRACDPSDMGEGERFVGSVQVTTDLMGDASFDVVLATVIPKGQFITSTATKIRGGEETTQPSPSTGEFSKCVEVMTPGVLQFSTQSTLVDESTSTATITVTRSDGTQGTVSVPVVVSPGSATRGTDFNVPTTQSTGVSVASDSPSGSDTVTLSFAEGETSKSFTINIVSDGTDEGDETVNLSLGTPVGTSLGTPATSTLTIRNTDVTPPEVAFLSPRNGSFIRSLSVIAGTARDAGSGIARVQLFIQRASDRFFFNGRSFTTAQTALSAEYDGSINRFVRRGGLPSASQLSPGRYILVASVLNGAGLEGRAAINVFVGQPPSVSFSSPTDGAHIQSFPVVSGFVRETGSGIARIELFIQRASDRFNFNGSEFVAEASPLSVAFNASTGRFIRRSGLPTASQLTPGRYLLTVRAFDRVGGVGRQTIEVFVDGQSSGSNLAPLSTIKVSTAKAQSATSVIEIVFTAALEAEAATDVGHYTVVVNGQPVDVEAANYNASRMTVTLALPQGSLQSGDQVTLRYDDLRDSGGNALSGKVGPLTAR